MDAKTVGKTISALRRRAGITQSALATALNISDKAVSRWESGLGFPEITQFPALADLFGVSVDYLMTGERKGIVIAGNILTDNVKTIVSYPEIGMLSNITDVSQAVGGCVPNTAIDIAKIDRSVPLTAVGCIGNDASGRYVTEQMQSYGINTERVTILPDVPTSFSDVMSLPSGERTFFHARGANARFSPEHIDLATLDGSMLHIGYILLLDRFDEADAEYGTVMARFLHDVQERGIKTSVDVVSSNDGNYKKTIVPALKYCNYAIMNEIECCSIDGFEACDSEGRPLVDNIRAAMEKLVEYGVKEKIIVHCKQAGFCLDVASGAFTVVPSLKIPAADIRGSVGAGDAYCAGCLYGLYNGYGDEELLRFASAAAACNLFADNSVDGMRPKNEVLKMEEKYGRVTL